MTTAIQGVGMQQIPQKKLNTFLTTEVTSGAIGGAVLGATLAKPWLKKGQVSDQFVREVSKQFHKNLKVPENATTVSTIFDHWVSAAGGFDKLNKFFEPVFKDVKKGVLKPAEEWSGLLKGQDELFAKALKSLKMKTAAKWGLFGACAMTISALMTNALLKKANVVEKEAK